MIKCMFQTMIILNVIIFYYELITIIIIVTNFTNYEQCVILEPDVYVLLSCMPYCV